MRIMDLHRTDLRRRLRPVQVYLVTIDGDVIAVFEDRAAARQLANEYNDAVQTDYPAIVEDIGFYRA